MSNDVVHVTSEYGDMQVVVFLPSMGTQCAYGFRPTDNPSGLSAVSRRDLAVMHALLQDALDDVDDERQTR